MHAFPESTLMTDGSERSRDREEAVEWPMRGPLSVFPALCY
jgi:hypothetical protein